MISVAIANDFVRNTNSPFTDFFALLTQYDISADNRLMLAYSPEKLKIMLDCINSVVEVLLKGLQDMGDLISAVDKESMKNIPAESIGQFISTTCNLIEALNSFALDVNYELRQKGVVDF